MPLTYSQNHDNITIEADKHGRYEEKTNCMGDSNKFLQVLILHSLSHVLQKQSPEWEHPFGSFTFISMNGDRKNAAFGYPSRNWTSAFI